MQELQLADYLGPLIPAVVIIAGMSLVPEPQRQKINVIFAAGTTTLYVNGGLGYWEFVYMFGAVIPAYLGLRHYRWIGVTWLLHTGWDLVHHFYGNPLWHWAETSSMGCAILDAVLAIWFFAGAPSIFPSVTLGRQSKENPDGT
jgi:hypothetical protein